MRLIKSSLLTQLFTFTAEKRETESKFKQNGYGECGTPARGFLITLASGNRMNKIMQEIDEEGKQK